MDVEITKSDGTSFLLSDHGIFIDDFRVGSISIESNYGTVEGRAGRVDYGATHGTRTITVPFHLQAQDLLDYPLVRDTLYGLVLDTESFFVRELRRPKYLTYDFVDMQESALDEQGEPKISYDSRNVYTGGKRYLVRVSGDFDIEQTLTSGEGEITLETTELPYAESVEMEHVESEGTIFQIFNAGNVLIHPYEMDLKITIDNVQGSTEFLQLKNETTGDVFRTTEAVTNSQTILLDGPNVTSNGLQYYRETNHQFIALKPGWNDFTVTGANSVKVSFDYRQYYK